MIPPTRITLTDGTLVFTQSPKPLQDIIARARRRREEFVRVNHRLLPLNRIATIEPPNPKEKHR